MPTQDNGSLAVVAGKAPRHAAFFEDHTTDAGHGQKSLRGGLASVLSRGLNAAVQVGSIVLLARLLTPEDYGLVTMVTAITGFAPMLVDLGTRDAVAQRERITEQELSTLFWITLAVSVAFAAIVAGSGPWLTAFYGEARLTPIALISAVTVVGSGLVCQHQGLLRRAMMFREMAIVEVIANVGGVVVALTMAYQGLGYWALVVRPVVTMALTAAGVWYFCQWIPGRPRMTEGVRSMLKFGLHLAGFSVADFAGRSVDSVAIGRLFGAETLGYYRKSLLVYDNSLDLTVSLHSVASVSLSKLRDQPAELRRLWAVAVSTLAFFAMPAFGGMAAVSQDLIDLALSEKWDTAGVLLSILALRGIPHVVERTLGWLHVAAGRPDRWMRWGLVAAGVQVVALLCGLPFGPVGIAWAYVLAMYVTFIPAIAYAGQPLGLGAKDVIKAIFAPLTGALTAVAGASLLRDTVLASMDALPRLFIVGVAYLAIYAVIVPGMFKLRKPMSVVRSAWSKRPAV